MGEVNTIGLDLAKTVFQAHGADASGEVVFRKKLRRDQLLAFFAGQPRCRVAMEACASAHYWAREISALGHETKLIAPAYVKPFVKRQKNDMADAEAICEAAQRPTMRFVAVKSAGAQGAAVVFRTRGGKERLGRTTKMGEHSLRRLLILGASAAAKTAGRDGSRASPWLVGMLARRPRMLVTVALANKTARIVWALMAHGGTYRAPAAAV